jgi:hypothetical protein
MDDFDKFMFGTYVGPINRMDIVIFVVSIFLVSELWAWFLVFICYFLSNVLQGIVDELMDR